MEHDNDTIQLSFFPDPGEGEPVGQEQGSPPVPPGTGPSLTALAEACLQCQACGLRRTASRVVFGEGNPHADLMLVGEGPGKQEDEMGRPFVGAAGQLLDKIFAAVGLSRGEVYITNVVKCRPPGNRLPTPQEVQACRSHLRAQIEIIRPRIIVCLGALASQTLISPQIRITRHRGKWVEREGIMIMPTFHPAALLRDPGTKRPVWEDFKLVQAAYRRDQ